MDGLSVTVNAGTLKTPSACMNFRYSVTDDGIGKILIDAFDPSDLRLKGVSMELNKDKYRELKLCLAMLDDAIMNFTSVGKLTKVADGVSVNIGGMAFLMPSEVFESTRSMIVDGKAIVAAGHLCKMIPALSMSGAREVVDMLADSLRQTGERI